MDDNMLEKNKLKYNKSFLSKYIYLFIVGLVLITGISYGLTFFIHNNQLATSSISLGSLTVNFTDLSINATGLTVPTGDSEGINEFSKTITITNTTSVNGKVKLTLNQTSGLNLTDLRYALLIDGAIQEISDVPSDGLILDSAIMANETMNVEVKLWPKSTYSGSETTFVGNLSSEISYLGMTAAESITNQNDLTNNYVNFNCTSSTCETWRIVKVENNRLVLTKAADYSGATSRVDSGKYNSALTFNDNSMITSVSTDNKNVYLAKTVKIASGSGTQTNPYTLINTDYSEQDEKVIATITYKDTSSTTTLATQDIYYGKTNYVSKVLNDAGFIGWSDGTNEYAVGSTITVTTDIILNAKIEVWAVNVSYDDTNTNFNCNDFQCAIEALNNYVG